jgi:hypothetical protein
MAMATSRVVLQFLFIHYVYLKLAMLIIDFREDLEDEDQSVAAEFKPSFHVALNGNSGNLEDD